MHARRVRSESVSRRRRGLTDRVQSSLMPSFPRSLPAAPDREPDIDDDFSTGLSRERWVASYLPQWTTPERARAHYEIVAAGIELRIDSDQPDWRPEDAPLRVSNLQTGVYSGPVGSPALPKPPSPLFLRTNCRVGQRLTRHRRVSLHGTDRVGQRLFHGTLLRQEVTLLSGSPIESI